MNNETKINYFNKKIEDIFSVFEVDENGLSEKKVANLLLKYGRNKLPESKIDNYFIIFLRQFSNPLVFVLLFASVVIFLTGERADGFVVLFVLFFNAVVGSIQEGRAQNIFASLKNFSKTNASVIRNGKENIISDEELVPGDIIVVREGDKIPADARLFSTESLQVNEAALTGESNPKFKNNRILSSTDVIISEQSNMIFKGTAVASGSGRGVVVSTGASTVIGNIAQKIALIDEELPLKKNIQKLSNFIIVMVVFVCLFLFVLGIVRGYSTAEIFSIMIAVSVSVIPEGLPIVVTLVLATGVWRMGGRNVLVKRLQAVEALGQVDVLAVDKTGTITKNELVVKEIYVGQKNFSIEGVGYDPKGEIKLDGEVIETLNHPELLMVGKIGSLCSGSHLVFDDDLGIWKVSGDPTEAATSVMSEKMGFKKIDLEKEIIKVEEIPFDYKLKYHAVLHKENENFLLSIIGVPEEILNLSGRVWSTSEIKDLSEKQKKELMDVFLRMSKMGLRVLAVGIKIIKKKENISKAIRDIDFVGFLGIEDSPRKEVEKATKRVELAGIKTVMITGDYSITARSIAEKAGIFKKGDEIIDGEEIDRLSEDNLANRLSKVSVFARVNPFHKLKIINAYKLAGKTIAMTGDGVNDALSLTSADVGVAMGRIGTEVAKEASDIVILDDNFGSIVNGIEEGRNVFKSVKRVVLYLFSTSLGEVLIIIGAIVLGFPLPILAPQILWLNLVTDGFLDVALSMEPKKKIVLYNKPSEYKSGIIDSYMVFRMFFMAIPMAIGTIFLFSQNYETDLKKAWTISLTLMAVFQWFNAWNCRNRTKSIFTTNPFSNKFLLAATGIVIVLQLLAVYHPVFQKFLRTVPLDGRDWIVIVMVAFSIVVVEEIRKLYFRIKIK